MKEKKKALISLFSALCLALIVQPLDMVDKVISIAENISRLTSKITIIDLQVEDLARAGTGLYTESEEAMVITNDSSPIYKKGAILHALINNPKNTNETIQDCDFVVTSIKKLKRRDIDCFLMSFEDSIGVYIINNGNASSEEENIYLKLLYDDEYNQNLGKEYKEVVNTIKFNVQSGEVKEIYNYSFDELDEIFSGTQETNNVFVRVMANIFGNEIYLGQIFKNEGKYNFFKYQNGDGGNTPMPIYLEYGQSDKVQVVNNFPTIPNNSTLPIDFILLPNESVEVSFYFDITFTNGNKVQSSPETVKISVPIYADYGDFYVCHDEKQLGNYLYDYIEKTHVKEISYGNDNFINPDFMYDPEQLYNQFLKYNQKYKN